MKLKIGDEVLVTAGKDKGRKGKIDKIFPGQARVRVPGINVYKKHVKGLGQEKGGIVEFSRPLPLSAVALLCPKCGKQTRIAWRIDKSGEKARICAKCQKALEVKAGRSKK